MAQVLAEKVSNDVQSFVIPTDESVWIHLLYGMAFFVETTQEQLLKESLN